VELSSLFSTFITKISPTKDQLDDLITGHRTLRKRLKAEPSLAPYIEAVFLQGSYARKTVVRPITSKRSDVDIVVVTNLHPDDWTPAQAMELFEQFVKKYYAGKYRPQNRSIGIELSYVELDLVITSSPLLAVRESERKLLQKSVPSPDVIAERKLLRAAESMTEDVELQSLDDLNDDLFLEAWQPPSGGYIRKSATATDWRDVPLDIPDCQLECWEPTHPLAQKAWTTTKNADCKGKYLHVVRALKWWWVNLNHPDQQRPKGYPLEHLIGQTCPTGIETVAEGVTRTLEETVRRYEMLWLLGNKPVLPDHGVPGHDVFAGVDSDQFAYFYDEVTAAAITARAALDADNRDDSVKLWRKLFGSRFPDPPTSGDDRGGHTTPQDEPGPVGEGRFA